MSQLAGVEKSLNEVFVDKAPKLPENGKKMLVQWMPWITVLGVVLYAWSVWAYYQLYQVANTFGSYANEISRSYGGGNVYDTGVGALGWFWIAIAGVQVVLLALAVPGLLNRTRKGWEMLFYGQLVGIVATVVSLFRGANAGGGFVSGILGTALGLYLLFQIRASYTK